MLLGWDGRQRQKSPWKLAGWLGWHRLQEMIRQSCLQQGRKQRSTLKLPSDLYTHAQLYRHIGTHTIHTYTKQEKKWYTLFMYVFQWVGSGDQGCFPTHGLQALTEKTLGTLTSETGTSRQELGTPQSGFLTVWPQKGFLVIYMRCLSFPIGRKLNYQLILSGYFHVPGTWQQLH